MVHPDTALRQKAARHPRPVSRAVHHAAHILGSSILYPTIRNTKAPSGSTGIKWGGFWEYPLVVHPALVFVQIQFSLEHCEITYMHH
jgi:hypothetical protein